MVLKNISAILNRNPFKRKCMRTSNFGFKLLSEIRYFQHDLSISPDPTRKLKHFQDLKKACQLTARVFETRNTVFYTNKMERVFKWTPWELLWQPPCGEKIIDIKLHSVCILCALICRSDSFFPIVFMNHCYVRANRN